MASLVNEPMLHRVARGPVWLSKTFASMQSGRGSEQPEMPASCCPMRLGGAEPTHPSTYAAQAAASKETAAIGAVSPTASYSAITDIRVPVSMGRLPVAFPTFAPRHAPMSAVTSSGCVLATRSGLSAQHDFNGSFHGSNGPSRFVSCQRILGGHVEERGPDGSLRTEQTGDPAFSISTPTSDNAGKPPTRLITLFTDSRMFLLTSFLSPYVRHASALALALDEFRDLVFVLR
jgi:hypothetical protein